MAEPWVFDWRQEKQGSFLQWLLPVLLKGDEIPAVSEASNHFKEVAVTIQVNGIEVDPAHFFDSVENSLKRVTEKEAQRIIDELLGDVFRPLNELRQEARASFVKVLREHGIEHRVTWDD